MLRSETVVEVEPVDVDSNVSHDSPCVPEVHPIHLENTPPVAGPLARRPPDVRGSFRVGRAISIARRLTALGSCQIQPKQSDGETASDTCQLWVVRPSTDVTLRKRDRVSARA